MRLPGQPSGPSKAEAWEQLRGLLAPRFGRDGLSPGTRARVRLGLWEVELDVDREAAPRTRLTWRRADSAS
jgi:hypothetical protein